MILWKTIPEGFESHGHKWRMNKWYEVEGELIMCENGFHASRLLPDAFSYVSPYWVCKVEIGDDFIEDGDKVVARRMRIIKKYRWTKRDNVRFAVWCARRSLQFFENEFPDDKRPRRAIEAAEKYLSNPCKRTKNAAESAASARSAEKKIQHHKILRMLRENQEVRRE